MKTATFLAGGAALVAPALAFPQYAPKLAARQDPNPWIAPGAGDLRCPCPGTNTIANHGYINRNGSGITMQAMQQGFLDAFGMGFDATAPGAQNAINLCSQITGTTCTAFDLNMLDVPHAIEHDASMSRDDVNMTFNQQANDAAINQTIWDMTLAFWGSATHVNVNLANTARLGRQQQAQQQDTPGWFQANNGGSETEHAFLLTIFNDPTNTDASNPQARVDWINELILTERVPTDLGWKSSTTIPASYLNQIVASVASATTVAPPASKRSIEPLLSVAANPASATAVANAESQARAQAGPAPTLVDPYHVVQTPEEWGAQRANAQNYVNELVGNINTILGTGGLL